MKCLIADCPPAVRDQIHVALDAFNQFTVDTDEGGGAVARLEKFHYDLVFVGVRNSRVVPGGILDRSLEPGRPCKVFVVGSKETVQSLKTQKIRARVMAFLTDPLSAVDLYRCLHRFLQRREVRSAL